MQKRLLPLIGLTAATTLASCAASGTKISPSEAASSNNTPSSNVSSSSAPAGGMVGGPFHTQVAKGFKIEVLDDRFFVPRRIAFGPDATAQKYDVFISESKANRVSMLRIENGVVTKRTKFVENLNQPYGLAFLNGALYIGNTDAVVKLPYKNGEARTTAKPQTVAALTQGGYNQHWTRNLLPARDGSKLFVTVGSSCNTCEEKDSQRAAISVMNPDGSDKRVYASGMRNPVGLALRPGTDELWTVVNERDNLGDDVPPDYLTLVKEGAFYGWPYAYTDINGKVHPDPTFGDKNPAKVEQTTAPTWPVQAHSAALGVAFYPQFGAGGTKGPFALFPKEYEGDAFLAFHGSWNRSKKTGYKIVRVHFEGGKPIKMTDFVTGFLDNGDEIGRPVDVQIAPDGSMLFSDDGMGRIWRVTRQ